MNKRIFLITGASSDLGVTFLEKLPVGAEDIIIAHYYSSKERLEGVALRRSLHMTMIQADFSNDEGQQSFINQIRELGLIPTDIIHITSRPPRALRFHNLGAEDFRQDFSVQVLSIARILKVLLPQMAKQRDGRIVFILTSYLLNKPPKYMSSYVTSKYALLGLMKSLVSEYAEKNIKINAVSPSIMDTKFLVETNEKVVELSAFQNPIKRNAVTADVVPTVLHLLSENASYLNGVNIPITGGSEF